MNIQANPQIEHYRENFNMMSFGQKKQFIERLKEQLEATPDMEWASFANDCIYQYNAEIRGDIYPREPRSRQHRPRQGDASIQARQAAPSAPARPVLIAAGAALIAYCALALAGSIDNFFAMDTWLPLLGGDGMRTTWTIFYGMAGLTGIYGLFLGVIGIIFSGSVHRAGMLQILGIVMPVLMIASIVIRFPLGVHDYLAWHWQSSLLLTVLELALPAVYIAAAAVNKKSFG